MWSLSAVQVCQSRQQLEDYLDGHLFRQLAQDCIFWVLAYLSQSLPAAPFRQNQNLVPGLNDIVQFYYTWVPRYPLRLSIRSLILAEPRIRDFLQR